MKKVTIIALHLGYGGIEKAIATLANNLCDKYDVEIVSTYKLFDTIPYDLNKKIDVKFLMDDKPNREEFKNSLKKLRFIKAIKEFFKALSILYKKKNLMQNYLKSSNSDIYISTRAYHNNMLSKYVDNSKVRIAWEHNHHNGNKKYINKVVNSVKNLDYFVLVSKDLYNFYNNELSGYKCKCVFIPNMIENKDYKESNLDNNNLITVSRLSEEKGLFDLIDVASLIKTDFNLNIIGDGALKEEINRYINEKKLSSKIHLLGFKDSSEVQEYLSNSSLYVMTSFTESFGIVLIEAFCHGVPAVAFDSAQGANELIDGKNGILIPNRDKEKMANFITNYLNNNIDKSKMKKSSLDTSLKYREDQVSKYWFDMLD